jgi:hypothetical protein
MFFRELSRRLCGALPSELRIYKIAPLLGHNWMRLRYPDFKRSYYELHFSSHSKHHATYFGEGPHDVVAFYLEGTRSRRRAWLNALQSYVPQINQELGFLVVSGEWGTKWAWVAAKLNGETRDPESYSNLMARFIHATYGPPQLVFQSI